jgi:3-isopropylmalate/(R)-2-methylmalate dehydratase small subunit
MEDFGFRSVIAPSFADIFRSNAFKNGILPIELAASQVETLFQAVQAEEGFALDIDLEDCTVTLPQGDTWSFEVDAFRRDCLLQGLDDIGITLESAAAIRDFEVQHQARFPWLFEDIQL